MEFLKKNWVKLVFITLATVGLIFAIINLADIMRNDFARFMDKAVFIAYLIFFLGLLMYLIAELFNFHRVAAMNIAVMGLLATIFFILAMVRLGEFDAGRMSMLQLASQMIVLGLFPLVWGVNRVLMHCMGMEKKKEKKRVAKKD